MKRVLIAGGSGFIGLELAKSLKAKNYWVRGVDIKPSTSNVLFDDFIEGDCTKVKDCQRALQGIDLVYCTAADTGGVAYVSQNSSQMDRNNLLILVNLLEESKKAGIKNFLFISSAWASAVQSVIENNFSALPKGARNYALTKYFLERVTLSFSSASGFGARIARIHNIFGPGAPYKGGKEGVVASLCRQLIELENDSVIELNAAPSDKRSFLYVDDCVVGIEKLMNSQCQVPVEIGYPEEISLERLSELLLKISGKRIRYVFKGSENKQSFSRKCDCTLMQSELGWQPQTSLVEALKMTYFWVKNDIERGKYGH